MFANPKSLKDLCIDSVCNNIEKLYIATGHPLQPKFKFVDRNVFLPMEISQILLTKLSTMQKLNDETLSLFSFQNVYLRNVILPKTARLTPKGLKTLKKHKIKKLNLYGLKCTIDELVDSLGKRNRKHLESLSLSNSLCMDYSYDHRSAVPFSKLQNLRSLDVSSTKFSTDNLVDVVKSLTYLESLDISHTKVCSLSPLLEMKNRLLKLSIYNLKNVRDYAPLKHLTTLTHLDLSSEKYTKLFKSYICDAPWLQFLTDPDWLPNLLSLDISGNGNIDKLVIQKFLSTHKKLTFLGLMHLDESGLDMFMVPTDPLFNPDLVVTGFFTLDQLLTSISHYINRPTYIEKCLFYLYESTVMYNSPRVDIIQIILNAMRCLPYRFQLQVTATACLFNMTQNDMALKLHPSVLVQVVQLTLDAMERFLYLKDIQKNAIFILSNEHIIKKVNLDKVKCAILVLDSLHCYNDEVMDRLSVAICSMLAVKMSASETSLIGSSRRYMTKFLKIVSDQLFFRTVNVTLRYTLTALWNLSDDSPKTCQTFIDGGGLQLYMDLLNTFIGDNSVEHRVLGMLYNVAEVPHLRGIILFHDNIIPTLRRLLHSEQIIISFFSAGIIAHLVCELGWITYPIHDKTKVLEELQLTVKKWDPQRKQLVAYRSLHHLINLLKSTDIPQVQLWAVWTIHHICTKYAKKYCAFLDKENGTIILQKIASDKSVDHEVSELCYGILDMMNKFKNDTNPVSSI